MLETFLVVSEVGSCMALTGTVVYIIDSMHLAFFTIALVLT